MSRIIAAIMLLATIFLIPIAIMSNASADHGDSGGSESIESTAPGGVVACKGSRSGNNERVECKAAGIVVLDLTIPLPVITITARPHVEATITLPPITLPPRVIRTTATVQVPGPTRIVPGPTRTVISSGPGTSRTIGPTTTITQSAAPRPTATVTKTVAVGQNKPHRGTLRPRDSDDDSIIPAPDLTPETTVGKAALGVGVLAAGMAVALAGMYSGYYIGYKDAGKNEAKFIRALLRKD